MKNTQSGKAIPEHLSKRYYEPMYCFAVIHESRNLKQARQIRQYVDLLRASHARYSLTNKEILPETNRKVKHSYKDDMLFLTKYGVQSIISVGKNEQ